MNRIKTASERLNIGKNMPQNDIRRAEPSNNCSALLAYFNFMICFLQILRRAAAVLILDIQHLLHINN